MCAAFLAHLDQWLQAGTSALVLVATVLGLVNKRHLGRVETKVHAASEVAKASHNALVDLVNNGFDELADEIGPDHKFPPREEKTDGT